MQNAINVRFTDGQFHFIQEFSKDEVRTPEQIIWLALTYYLESQNDNGNVCVYKMDSELTEEQKEKLAKREAGEQGIYVDRTYSREETERIIKSFKQNVLLGVQQ